MTALWPLHLQHAATPEQAADIARAALDNGADPAQVAGAMTEWSQLYDAQVQEVGA